MRQRAKHQFTCEGCKKHRPAGSAIRAFEDADYFDGARYYCPPCGKAEGLRLSAGPTLPQKPVRTSAKLEALAGLRRGRDGWEITIKCHALSPRITNDKPKYSAFLNGPGGTVSMAYREAKSLAAFIDAVYEEAVKLEQAKIPA